MNKEQLKEILILIFKENEKDREKQKCIDSLVKVFAENEYPPILDGVTTKLLSLLKILNVEVEDWTSYFLYEAPSFYERQGFVAVVYENISYNIHCDVAAIDFIINKVYE